MNPNKRIVVMSQCISRIVWKKTKKINNVADAMLKSSISHWPPGSSTLPLKYMYVTDLRLYVTYSMYNVYIKIRKQSFLGWKIKTYPSSAQSRILVRDIPYHESNPWVFGWKQWSSFDSQFTPKCHFPTNPVRYP